MDLKRAHKTRKTRRGYAASSLLVVLFPVLAVGIGLAIEVGLHGTTREHLQTAADAAALAGAVELLDPLVVQPGHTTNTQTLQQTANTEAGLYANFNLMMGAPLVYPTHTRPVFVVFGNVADPTDWMSPLGPNDDQHPCNTIVVTIERSQRLKNPVPLRLGPFLGILPGNVVATSRGTIDQRVYGFRPNGQIATPVIPFAVLAAGSPVSWTVQASAAATPNVNDNFTVNPTTGQVSNGPDGIPEVLVSAPFQNGPAAGPSDNMVTINFASPNPTATLIQFGLRPIDLTALGGQFAFGNTGTLTVQASTAVDAGLTGVLQLILGANRIWPLYSTRSGTDTTISQFVAGRIASVSTVAPGRLVLAVQPSVYPTSTALVQAGQALNPYVAKLSLTR